MAADVPTMVTTVRAVVGTVALLALMVCTTRLYLRKFVIRAFGLDDYFVIVSLGVYISLCTYLFVASSVKISLIVFLMRIFPTKSIRYFGIGIIVFLVLVTISGELPLILQCMPVRAAYDKTVANFKCFSPDAMFGIEMYQGVVMFAVDIVIFLMPIPTIWKLQMPIQRRLSIIGLFSLGKHIGRLLEAGARD
ncbi:hypothetical protein NUU61_006638 [Penicillium alfredii]|uniref:Rhodopsin domain-containing protein n=1 Tax=Penicillium alfredii TaxID=1506179 RepID=A0A9W9K3I3_9EURO|nr:uncharacterized protein NUU61_006638 [Penicillium alfredii]KAJ5091768.1 hypothetical protein NUU61_006638 [Penicillium alfredii]